MVYQGCVHNGMVVINGDIRLPEGLVVTVEVADVPTNSPQDDSIYRLCELAVPTGIPDLAMNIDHHLYGHPKASDASP
jgi:hypothetical protein